MVLTNGREKKEKKKDTSTLYIKSCHKWSFRDFKILSQLPALGISLSPPKGKKGTNC